MKGAASDRPQTNRSGGLCVVGDAPLRARTKFAVAVNNNPFRDRLRPNDIARTPGDGSLRLYNSVEFRLQTQIRTDDTLAFKVKLRTRLRSESNQ